MYIAGQAIMSLYAVDSGNGFDLPIKITQLQNTWLISLLPYGIPESTSWKLSTIMAAAYLRPPLVLLNLTLCKTSRGMYATSRSTSNKKRLPRQYHLFQEVLLPFHTLSLSIRSACVILRLCPDFSCSTAALETSVRPLLGQLWTAISVSVQICLPLLC